MADPLITPMGGVASVAAIGLGAVFVASAVAKARHPRRTAQTFAGLGLPFPRALAYLVPGAEGVLAVALVVIPRAGAVATIVLLAAFTAVLIPQLGRPEPIACGCFGTAANHPISVVEPARNALLALVAVTVLTGAKGDHWLAPRLPDLVIATAGALIAVLGLQLLALRRDAGAVFAQHPPPTRPAPVTQSPREALSP